MGGQTVAARDLAVGQHVAGRGPVRRVTEVSGMVEVTYEDGFPLLYPLDHPMLVVAPVAEGGPDTVAARYLITGMHMAEPGGPVYQVLHVHCQPGRVYLTLLPLAGGPPVVESHAVEDRITVATPEQVEQARADGQRYQLADALEDLVRDIRLQRLPLAECGRRLVSLLPAEAGLTYSRTTDPEQVTTSCSAGVACTGRDGKPSPHACPVCRHCAEHGAGGCAARKSDTGRRGCTGGGA